MNSNVKIIQAISNINGINISIQAIKRGWIEMGHDNPLRKEITYGFYLKIGIVNREIIELRKIQGNDQHLSQILATLEPFTRELDYYCEGIKTYRDRYLAHYNRGNNHSYKPISDILTPNLVLPRSDAEVEVLLMSIFFLSDMLKHFYMNDWRTFEKEMLDEFERSIIEFAKNFVPRKPVVFKDYVAEVNSLAIENGLVSAGQNLITFSS